MKQEQLGSGPFRPLLQHEGEVFDAFDGKLLLKSQDDILTEETWTRCHQNQHGALAELTGTEDVAQTGFRSLHFTPLVHSEAWCSFS